MIKITTTTLFLIFALSAAHAQQIVDEQLKDPIRSAIRTNRELAGKDMENQKTKIEGDMVGNKRLPSVSAAGFYSYFNSGGKLDLPTVPIGNTPLSLFEGAQDFRLQGQVGLVGVTATQVIFSGLQISNGQKALKEKLQAQNYLLEADKETIAKEIISTFDQLMLLKEVEKLIVDSEKRLNKEHLKVVKAIENGMAIPYDRDKIKLAMLELEAKKVELAGSKELLLQKLEQDTHIPADQLQHINYELKGIVINKEENSIENRYELKALDASQRAYEYVYKKEKGSGLPQVFAFGSASYSNVFKSRLTLQDVSLLGDVHLRSDQLQLFPTFIVGVGAKWEIFKGGEHKNKLKQAKLDLDINQNKKDDISEKLELLLKKNKVEYNTANQKLKVNDQQVQVAKNNLNLSSKQYQEGLIDVTELLASENDYYKSSLGYYSQILQQRKSALEVLHTTGDLLNSILK
ncbi:TolC family protein [Sphingobacterium spiritivorum]|uniref:TolC family protein n=1 Tax=Sphingobacterium spiritivorum TaxID=258 RepID=UPI003DA50D3E